MREESSLLLPGAGLTLRKRPPRRNVAIVLMNLEDCYRLLDVQPGASDEELRAAHRDLTKVWHPDRFGNDPLLRRKAEEKLKAINEAYEAILAFNHGHASKRFGSRPAPSGSDDSRSPRASAVVSGRHRAWAILCALAAGFLLLRRPTPGGLIIALVLLIAAIVLATRWRKAAR